MGQEYVGLIRGPPGCGKSTSAWLFVLRYAELYPHQTVCWVHAATRERIILNNGTIREDRPDMENLHRVDEEKVDVLFIDGVVERNFEKYKEAATLAFDEDVGKVMLVISLQFTPRAPKFIGKVHEVRAWTLQEYQAACAHAPFFAQVRDNLGAETGKVYNESERQELVERKFTVAGHSARWMFDMTEEGVLESIEKELQLVANIRDLFDFIAGGQCSPARNSLVVFHPNNNIKKTLVFTSSAVTRILARMATTDLIRQLHMQARGNGNLVLEEQATCMDFLQSVRTNNLSERVQYVAKPDPETGLRAVFEPAFDHTFASQGRPVIEFHRDVLTEESAGMHLPGTWFVPRVYNQGGFDCVQLLELSGAPTLRFVHVTTHAQLDHPIRLDYMLTFLLALNEFRARVQPHPEPPITAMEVVVMLPHDVAIDATPPSEWDVTEEQSTIGNTSGSGSGSGGGAGPKIAVTRRVAGCKLT